METVYVKKKSGIRSYLERDNLQRLRGKDQQCGVVKSLQIWELEQSLLGRRNEK